MNIFANHAPLWVFALLGAIIAVLAVVLYFANTPGGGDHDYLYADPTRNYYMNIPPKWQIFGFGTFTGSRPYQSYGPFGGFRSF